jgi:phosphomannomutase
MAETDAIFGGEHSGHFYFRDFWRADSGMLAALHTLAALAETDRRCPTCSRSTSGTSSAARSTPPVDDQARDRRQSSRRRTRDDGRAATTSKD